MNDDAGLLDAYRSALGASQSALDAGDLAQELGAIWAAAASSTPAVKTARDEFLHHLARHALDGRPPPREHAAELALTFACARGDASALRELEPRLTRNVARAIARIDRSAAFADTVAQALRTRLLVGPAPKIAEYAGRGSLDGWIRTAAVRTALNLRRGRANKQDQPLGSGLRAAGMGPDEELLRARYRGDFEDALRTALARLPSRERALLALHVCDGLSSDKIAALYRVGRSTVKRWLIAAREGLANETKRELRARLALTSSEFESVAAMLCSAVDVSILRLLGEREGAGVLTKGPGEVTG